MKAAVLTTTYVHMLSVSKRLELIPASPIRKLVPFAQAAKQKGITVHHLNIGDPDIKTPEVMLQTLKSWDLNPIGYAQSKGQQDFLDAMVSYYHSLGFSFITAEHMQVTVGGSEAIGMALFAICNPGDEVLVFEPFYANYASYAALYGVQIVPVPTLAKDGFHLPSFEQICSYITPKTKGILYCNPNNPTGTVYTKKEMDMLADIVKQYNIYLLADEVYREFVYDKAEHVSILSYMDKLGDRTILLDSLSKRYSLCGARLGVLVSGSKTIMEGVLKIAQGRLSAGLIDQKMAVALTDVPASYTQSVQKEYQLRRDVVYSGLQRMDGVFAAKPEGAFYCIADLPVDDSEAFCTWLLTDFQDHKETVMLAPAGGFYKTPGKGKNQVRIAYVLEQTKLVRALEILHKALEVYNV